MFYSVVRSILFDHNKQLITLTMITIMIIFFKSDRSPTSKSNRPTNPSSVHPALPRLRMAEKKRIRRINADDDEVEQPQQVTGSDLSSVGVIFNI